MSGRVVHFEIPFDDEKRANEFYAEAFGWKLLDLPGYTMAASGPTTEQAAPAKPGFINGAFGTARFFRPQGLALYHDKLLVADSENHAIRQVDFKTGQVGTLAP